MSRKAAKPSTLHSTRIKKSIAEDVIDRCSQNLSEFFIEEDGEEIYFYVLNLANLSVRKLYESQIIGKIISVDTNVYGETTIHLLPLINYDTHQLLIVSRNTVKSLIKFLLDKINTLNQYSTEGYDKLFLISCEYTECFKLLYRHVRSNKIHSSTLQFLNVISRPYSSRIRHNEIVNISEELKTLKSILIPILKLIANN